jgi:hypothetical protein
MPLSCYRDIGVSIYKVIYSVSLFSLRLELHAGSFSHVGIPEKGYQECQESLSILVGRDARYHVLSQFAV